MTQSHEIVPVVSPDGRILIVSPDDDVVVDIELAAMADGVQQFPTRSLPPEVLRRRRFGLASSALRERPPLNLLPLPGQYLVIALDLEATRDLTSEYGWHLVSEVAGHPHPGAWLRELQTGLALVVVKTEGRVVWACSRERLCHHPLPKPWHYCPRRTAKLRLLWAQYQSHVFTAAITAVVTSMLALLWSYLP